MAAKRKVPWQGPAKLWAVGKREYKVEYRGGSEVIVIDFPKTDLKVSSKTDYDEGVDIDKKLKEAFNTLDFLSDDAKAFIGKVVRDDAGGNFCVEYYTGADKMAALRQTQAQAMRALRARMTPEQVELQRAKDAERKRLSREQARQSP